MKLSNKAKFMLFTSLIILNILLRFQTEPHEIGVDSFKMHIMTNSISEFGYAKWIIHPLSIIGLYPASYSSTMQFLISGISQSMGFDNESILFLYCVFLGLLSMFTAYLMAEEIVDNDFFKFLAAFGFSTVPAVLGYSTWTMPTRGLFVVLAPMLIFLLLRCRKSLKFVPLTFFLAVFLFATHHLFYFLLPAFFSFFIIISLDKYVNSMRIPEKIMPLFFIFGFIIMFLIPFLTGRFIESSRYASIDISYLRYVGILIIPALGGLIYLIFKNNKSFEEMFLLLTLIFLTIFVYQQTYMKMFLPVFMIPLACIGLINILKLPGSKKYLSSIFILFLLLQLTFAGYYQFIQDYSVSPFNERYIEESTYSTGQWIKDYGEGQGISNDALFGNRIFASSTTPLLTDLTTVGVTYGFIKINISEFKRYPIYSDNFWLTGYDGPDYGQQIWWRVHNLMISSQEFHITYFVENTKANGNLIWNHTPKPSQLLFRTYDESHQVYDSGNARIWKIY